MNEKEVVKQLKDLIAEKEDLLEGDELDEFYKDDIEILKNALKLIEELSVGRVQYNNTKLMKGK